jgi:hypothetical protein
MEVPSLRFRRQHEELMALAAKLFPELVPAKLAADPTEARRLMARFRGLLLVHAAMENEALYPRLLEHPRADVREIATKLLAEVGTLYDGVNQHALRWPDAAAIQRDPTSFVRETMDLLKTLGRRMARENHELYPLADAG